MIEQELHKVIESALQSLYQDDNDQPSVSKNKKGI